MKFIHVKFIHVKVIFLLFWIGGLVFLPTAAIAETGLVEHGVQNKRSTQQDGIEFKIMYENAVYTVFMRPNATPAEPNLTLTAQVTIKAPHGEGENRFEVTNLQALVAGTTWDVTSRVDAPSEDPTHDYISFTVTFSGGDLRAFDWTADQEVAVFSFKNGSGDAGPINMIADCDDFMPPNSAGTNPGNQITVLTLGAENAYIGNYDVDLPACETTGSGVIYLPIVAGE